MYKKCLRSSSRSGIVQVFAGNLEGTNSLASYYSPLLGADLARTSSDTTWCCRSIRSYEHAILVMNGDCALDNQSLEERMLFYLGTRAREAGFSSTWDGRTNLLHRRTPVPDSILMWWNFVAGTPRRYQAARGLGAAPGFGEVSLPDLGLTSASLTRFAVPNPVS